MIREDFSVVINSLLNNENEMIQEIVDADLVLDIDLLKNFNNNTNKNLIRKYNNFLEFWDHEHESLLDIRVYINEIKFNDLEKCFQEEIKTENMLNNRYIYSIWTLGKNLECGVSDLFQEKKNMQALFLDLYGSKILLALHRKIQELIQIKMAVPLSENIISELYPGNNFYDEIDLGNIIRKCGAEETIKETKYGIMLNPQKSMYSFFVVGKGPYSVLKNEEKCASCSGAECVYYQLGGCHNLF